MSTPDVVPLLVMVLLAALAVWGARRHGGPWEVPAARMLAMLVLAAWVGEYLADIVEAIWSARFDLPLQLTDAVSLATIAALWTRRAAFVELAYFWALTASLQAVLTPDLSQPFPSVFYFTFFTYHVGAVVAACYLVFGARLAPRRGALWRVYAATWAWAALAAVADLLTRGNYMYLRAKPAEGTLLSLLGPWPWYIGAIAVIGLAMFFALDAIAKQLCRDRAAPAPA
jgi:hypothetical integral membrane protein (TIGR02206 family)